MASAAPASGPNSGSADEVGSGIERYSIPCGSVAGVPIRLHLLLPLVMLLSAAAAAFAGQGITGVFFVVLVSGPLVLLTVLVHELGHVLAARRCGCTPDSILLWPLGGLALIDASAIGPRQQIVISGAGPATHLPMIAIWMALMAATNDGQVTTSTAGMSFEHHFIALVCVAMLLNNIGMFLFNLLIPCFPLDCSQIILASMLLCGSEVGTAAMVMVGLSAPILVILAGIGIYGYFTGTPSATLHIMLAVWLGAQSWKLHQARLEGRLASYPLFANAMRMQADCRSGPASAGDSGGRAGSFKPFQGEGVTLGRPAAPPPSSQVCMGAALAAIVAVTVACQVSAPGTQ
ncbi:unnamed protein product [Prorocentrum cordatum]|uniref:Peptidase M50 domain-containing protein n=1 Tax=Prorocentrum cordatum TaxID=2364126 RepID=A0ABN9TFL4_9DINO|nr:unnamed protein product [Polarella glacialis]